MTKTDAFFLLILHMAFYGLVLTGTAYLAVLALERLAYKLADRSPHDGLPAPRQSSADGSTPLLPAHSVERPSPPTAGGALPPLFPDVVASSTAAASLPDTSRVGSRRPVVLDASVAGDETARCDGPDLALRGRVREQGPSAGMSRPRPPHVFTVKDDL